MEIVPALGLQAAARRGWLLCGRSSRPGWLQTRWQTGLQAIAAHTLLLRPQQWRATTWRAAGASLCSCFHLCGMLVPAEVAVMVLGGSHSALANKAPTQATPSSQQSRSACKGTSKGPEFLLRQCLQASNLHHNCSQHRSRPQLHQAAHLLEVTL